MEILLQFAFLAIFLSPSGSIHARIRSSEIVLYDAFGAPNLIKEELKRAKKEIFAFVRAADVKKKKENCDFVHIPNVVKMGYSKGLPDRHIFNYKRDRSPEVNYYLCQEKITILQLLLFPWTWKI